MGSGQPRSNIVPMSASRQVVMSDGGGALICQIDDVFTAADTPASEWEGVGAVVVAEGQVVLHLPSGAVVLLVSNAATRRLMNCMTRGYRFLGSVVGDRLVRIWNEPPS